MNPHREQMLKDREQQDAELFEKIKGNPKPDIYDLWALSEERFIEWRKLHDFPVLLNHFDKTLILFKEWKSENKLTNDIIINTGTIAPFLEFKKLAKNKTLFLTKQTVDGRERTIVANKNMGKQQQYLGRTFHFELLQTFTSYLDWLKSKGKYQEILYINSRSAPNSDGERVYIHADVYATKSDFELLKMGGIPLPVNAYGILFRGKKLEFVNLCGLKFTGEVSFGEEGNLSCSYCACDNWVAENFNMALLELEHCTVGNFTFVNSEIQQWLFYDCFVSGDFIGSKLYRVDIFGGSFNPIMQDCTLAQTHLKIDPNIQDGNFYGYRTFKKIYQSQGDDDIAKHYFIRENEYIRKRLKGVRFLTKSLSYYYWEYGRKPHRIIYISVGIIILFGFLYWLNSNLIAINSSHIQHFGFGDSFYFSTITFTTLGYGDFSPLGWLRILSSIEAFSGVVNMGFLIAGYSNNKY
jgi:hypothetical protein